jgi:hypothetical protein
MKLFVELQRNVHQLSPEMDFRERREANDAQCSPSLAFLKFGSVHVLD